MKSTFDPKEYMKSLGVDLVNAFDKAGQTTHPHSVGSGREKSIKDQLKRVLPAGIGVGSGFVIDSYGNTSTQCDIIIYEEQFALRFAPNDDDLYTYYNCENVIAVGQVKSDASIADVRDAIKNLKCVSELKRFQELCNPFGDMVSSHRGYLNGISGIGTVDEQFDPEHKSTDRIFTFFICKSFKTPADSILAAIKESCNEKKTYPNRLLSVDDDYCFWLKVDNENNSVQFSAVDSTHFTKQKVDCAFGKLVAEVSRFIRNGRSVPLNSAVYLPNLNGLPLKEPLYPIILNAGQQI